jgi:hypothetical protein
VRWLGAALLLAAACSRKEPDGTCEQAVQRLAALGGDGLEDCAAEQRSPRELGCMKTAPNLEELWRCEWLDPGAKSDLKRAHDGPIPAALSKMVEANQLRRESSATFDPEPLYRSLPMIDEAATALRGFDPEGRKVKEVLDTMATAIEQYRGAIAKSAHSLVTGDQALLDQSNREIEAAMTMVVHAENELREGMVETGLKSK